MTVSRLGSEALSAARQRFAGALLLAVCALLIVPSLGLYPLFDVDEGAFSEATREILQSGDWVSTTLNGVPRYDKPILIYWLQAVSVELLGLNEFALRLPSALAALCWVLAIVRFATPRLGATNALLGGWVAATSLGVLSMSRAATADALLNALLAATMFDLWRHLDAGGKIALRRAYLWMALGVLTKGPIALLIPFAVTFGYCLSVGRWRNWPRLAFDPLGWAILLAVAGPWYATQLVLHGRDFVDGFLLRHNLERFSGTLEGHGGSLWYYFAVAPLLLLPWSGLLWRMLRRVPQHWRDPLSRYLLLWFAFVFVFFSLSGTKLPHYLLYGMTPLFILAACRLREDGNSRNLLLLPCLLLLLLPFVPRLVAHASAAISDPRLSFYAGLAARATAVATRGYYLLTVLGALAALALLLARPWPAWRRSLLASAALAAALGWALAPWLGELLNGPVKNAALVAAQLPGVAVQWEIAAPSFSVYRRQITPSRPPAPGELAITRTDRLDPRVPVDLLFAQAGVALVRRRQ
ncbi:MAG TPA: glycosyltransferase family 39 protein [Burkholderiaceae bacterium]|nr:glycosyltransferase family 39 protein [Burkholderiaceae bacterium]